MVIFGGEGQNFYKENGVAEGSESAKLNSLSM